MHPALSQEFLQLLAMGGAVLAMLILMRRQFSLSLSHPFCFLCLFYLFVFVIGAVLNGFFEDLAASLVGTYTDLGVSSEEIFAASSRVLQLVLLLQGAAALYFLCFRKRAFVRRMRLATAGKQSVSTRLRRSGSGWLWLLMPLPIVALTLGYGFDDLLSRGEYLVDPNANHQLAMAGYLSSPAAVFITGYLVARARNPAWKMIAVACALTYLVMYFSLATRILVLSFPIFFLGWFSGNRRSRLAKVGLLASILAAPVLIAIPLYSRSLNQFGLLPFFEQAVQGGYSNEIAANSLMLEFLYNVLTGGPLAAHLLSLPRLDTALLTMSVSPLLGGMVGWDRVADDLRVNMYIPYNAVGELLNHGFAIAAGYFVVVGLLFAHLENFIDAQFARQRAVVSCAAIIIGDFFVFYSTQYNLRSSTRLLYYLLALLLLMLLLRLRLHCPPSRSLPDRPLQRPDSRLVLTGPITTDTNAEPARP